jgi:hypothetical protein
MLRKLTKKNVYCKRILVERVASQGKCYADCVEWCVVNGLLVSTDHDMSALY